MNLSFFIARRYFFSRKKQSFINVISILSMLVVAFGTAALVIVLSVFNGLEGLIRNLYNTFDAEIKVSVIKGNAFATDSTFIAQVKNIKGVGIVTQVVEENALVEYRNDKRVVKVKGVSSNFLKESKIDKSIVLGDFDLYKAGKPYAVIGRGIQYGLNVSLNNAFYPLKISYPNNKQILNPVSQHLLTSRFIPVSGIFAIEKQYDDNYIFTPIAFARDLFNMPNQATSLEIKPDKGAKISTVKTNLKRFLGNTFQVQDSDEQHASLLKAIEIERLFVYLIFVFLLLIAAINIFFSLSMLGIEKKKDVAILFSMGASRNLIKKIFLAEGLLVAIVGTVAGLTIGFLTVFLQEKFGFVSMGMETAIVDAYPVQIHGEDFIYTGLIILVLTLLISYRPALLASKIKVRENI